VQEQVVGPYRRTLGRKREGRDGGSERTRKEEEGRKGGREKGFKIPKGERREKRRLGGREERRRGKEGDVPRWRTPMTMRTTRQTTRVKQKPGLRAYLKARRAACWGCCWKKKRRHDTERTPPPGVG